MKATSAYLSTASYRIEAIASLSGIDFVFNALKSCKLSDVNGQD